MTPETEAGFLARHMDYWGRLGLWLLKVTELIGVRVVVLDGASHALCWGENEMGEKSLVIVPNKGLEVIADGTVKGSVRQGVYSPSPGDTWLRFANRQALDNFIGVLCKLRGEP